MARRPVENLSSPGIERGLRLVIWDGQCTQVMMVMTGGVFLVDFALRLGASGLAIGLISAVPALANLAQLPSIALVERLRYRRSLAVATSGASRLLFVGLAALPFFALSGPLAITAVVTTLAAVYGLGAVSYCAWSSWMRDLVPADRLGAVFARRMMLMAGLGAILGPLAGAYVEWFRAGWPGLTPFTYVPIFALGAIFGLIGVWVLAITPEPAMPAPAGGRGFGARVAAPLRDRNYRAILLFNVAWNAAANLAAPFFAVYMLKRIGLEVGLITVLSAAFQLANLA
ncbi:MAG: MFS transporter, partial [Alphaproteobacteria bacterium]|nr:MFS transporter [Alphaproteobacteria bacterium]